MSKEKTEKTFFRLEPKFEEILASADGDTSPFIETFVFQGENVSQENLGTIAGILEVGDESEESSYIVNYIISVIKKERQEKGCTRCASLLESRTVHRQLGAGNR